MKERMMDGRKRIKWSEEEKEEVKKGNKEGR